MTHSDSSDRMTAITDNEVDLLREVVRKVTQDFVPPDRAFPHGELWAEGGVHTLNAEESKAVERALLMEPGTANRALSAAAERHDDIVTRASGNGRIGEGSDA